MIIYIKYYMPYVKSKVAREYFGVSNDTLRHWTRDGKIEFIRVGTGPRLFKLPESPERAIERRKILYCRVSSNKQKEDLTRQIKYLQDKYPGYEVVKEIASGINFKRKALQGILDASLKGMVSEVVVAHRDRLCRIAFEHFKWLFSRNGTNLVIDSEEEHTTEEDLTNDLLSIIHVFSCRHYGARRKYTSKHDETNPSEETPETE